MCPCPDFETLSSALEGNKDALNLEKLQDGKVVTANMLAEGPRDGTTDRYQLIQAHITRHLPR